MIAIGCTGGIGSGKSTVAAMLAAHGAEVISADDLARACLMPGAPGYAPTLARFGTSLARPDGSIDREALAHLVFADEGARRDLEAIVHPLVAAAITSRLAQASSTEDVVVVDVPLLVETGGRSRYRLDGVLVVDTPEDLAVARLVEFRGYDAADARARLAAQADRATRLRAADFIILNLGTLDELEEMTRRAWQWIEQLRDDAGHTGH